MIMTRETRQEPCSGDHMESIRNSNRMMKEVSVVWQMKDHRDNATRYRTQIPAKDRDLPEFPRNPENLQERGKYWPDSRRRPALQAGGERIL